MKKTKKIKRRKIDPLIKNLVIELNKAGFKTTSACQGATNRNHIFKVPIIDFCTYLSEKTIRSTRHRLHKYLQSKNYGWYSISEIYDYHSGWWLLRLEFYSLELMNEKMPKLSTKERKYLDSFYNNPKHSLRKKLRTYTLKTIEKIK